MTNSSAQNAHGGNWRRNAERAGVEPTAILDFSANLNPLGPPPWLSEAMAACVADAARYPDPDYLALRQAISRHIEYDSAIISDIDIKNDTSIVFDIDCILPANGSNQLFYLLPLALLPRRVLVCPPCYAEYELGAGALGIEIAASPLCRTQAAFRVDLLRLSKELRSGDLLYLGHPNNPTGELLDASLVEWLAKAHPDAWIAVDEAFLDFARPGETLARLALPNLLVLRSFTKFYGIPGLRLGCLIAAPPVLAKVRPHLPAWSVNVVAEQVGIRALTDRDYAEQTVATVRAARRELAGELAALAPLHVYPSTANYLLVELEETPVTAAELAERLLLVEHIAIRDCATYTGLNERFFRVAVRVPEENARLIAALKRVLRR